MNYYAQQIKDIVSVYDVCRMYGIEVNARGFAKCCFHAEKTASMKVFKDGVKCFGCGEYAQNAIDFVMKLFGLKFYEACEKINSDFALGLAIDRPLTLREKRETEQRYKELKAKREAEKAKHEALENAYHNALTEWVYFDRQRIKYKPKTLDDLNSKYAEAVKKIAIAADALETAEVELYEYEHRRKNDC